MNSRDGWRHAAMGQRPRRMVGRLFAVAVLTSLVVLAGCGGSASGAGQVGAHPAATATLALPTPTAGPPSPTPTAQERQLTAIARQAIGDLATDVQATYDAAARSVTVATIVGGSVPNSPPDIAVAQERVKTICFRAQEALWTSALAPRSVTITVAGPILDQYADAMTAAYGAAVLTATTAQRFAWSSLTPDAAWEKYDNVFLRPDYNDAS